MANIKKITDTKCCQECGRTSTLRHCQCECKMGQPLWKIIWKFLKKLNIHLPYHPDILFLDISPREMKASVHTKIHTEMFIAALFIRSKTENNSCPSTGKWINTDIAYNGTLLLLLSHFSRIQLCATP